jgi:hypothetical protein
MWDTVLMMSIWKKIGKIEQTEDYRIYRRGPANKEVVGLSYNDFGL